MPSGKPSLPDLVQDMTDKRQQLEQLLEVILSGYDNIRLLTRRSSDSDDLTKYYLNLANAGTRFAASMLHGLKRTAALERSLKVATKNQADRKRLEEIETEKVEQRKAKELARAVRAEVEARRSVFYNESASDALNHLYGGE